MDNVKNLLGHLLHCTVRIHCENTDGTTSTGTGFVFGFERKQGTFLTVITNRHVLKKSNEIRITLTRLKEKGKPDIGKHKVIIFQDASDYWHGHPDNDVDLALLPLAQALNASKKEGDEFFFTILEQEFIAKDELLESLSAFEDIVMIGYPNSLWDKINNLPIIRKGITATHPRIKYNGRPEFVIDAACFNGSSGSPVFLANIGNYIDKNGEITVIGMKSGSYTTPKLNEKKDSDGNDVLFLDDKSLGILFSKHAGIFNVVYSDKSGQLLMNCKLK
ncbi:trypsin-like peptidase domain-containing protein [Providencia sp. CIM-Carb-044]|uniref:trypsin-like peptidase domain-containing protein n=1 Tax=Providencia sp. CIM-Carb-044 TaxID=3096048 RepID=UPI0029D67AB0|nr:trypsin-like peptidase domain-containing protein [Providencia sp. CIM-Carb-044]MDX7424254.1 trypsin-like peptidase domain-containing protein [Providencia sp. CIM-Carb-044]